MTDNWQPGDLALCVARTPNPFLNHPEVVQGSVSAVEALAAAPDCPVALVLVGRHSLHPNRGHRADRFRKIHPLNEAEHAAAMRELNAPVREKVS